MKQKNSFLSSVCALAIPVALQSMLQSSFSIVDQIMIGQLGSVAVAGVGLAGKFASIYSVVVSAVGAVGGIMISQYLGQNSKGEVRRSFWLNLLLALALAMGFTLVCALLPGKIMGLYSTDPLTIAASADYLRIIAWTFLPMAGATMLSTLFRCLEKAQLPLYASLSSAVLNTVLNYILIFGKLGFSPMGAEGAAIATLCSQWLNFLVMLLMLSFFRSVRGQLSGARLSLAQTNWKQYLTILLPILVCEFVWSLGENVYAAIYGRIGTDASAAMTLTNPVQGLMIGALCGLSQAAGVIIGKKLGARDRDGAYQSSKKLLLYGFVGSILLSAVILLVKGLYVEIYQVEDSAKALTVRILTAYALIAPFKVENMILGSGILRSGGQTKYVMCIDMMGTWLLGVPLGLLAAFVWKMPIYYVYFILSLEECFRFAVGLVVLRRKKWMHSLETAE